MQPHELKPLRRRLTAVQLENRQQRIERRAGRSHLKRAPIVFERATDPTPMDFLPFWLRPRRPRPLPRISYEHV